MRDTPPDLILRRDAALPHLLALALVGALLGTCDSADERRGTPAATASGAGR